MMTNRPTLFTQVTTLAATDPRAAMELARTNSVAGESMIDRIISDAAYDNEGDA